MRHSHSRRYHDGMTSLPLNQLPPLRVDGRLERLRDRLAAADLQAAAFSDSANVRWLTGFTGSNGTLIVRLTEAGDHDAMLVTDARYAEQAPAETAAAGCSEEVEVVIARSAADAAAESIAGVDRLGLEATVSWAAQIRWDEAVDAEVVPITEMVEEMRSVKDASELARTQAAADIADRALGEIIPMLRPGTTELEVQRTLDDAMRRLGAVGPAYDTIVASGPNSALPHARPTGRRFEPSDLLVIDVGAIVDGYRSDMTRTFSLGPPTAETKAMLEVVTSSQAEGMAAVRPGVEASEIDRVCRSAIAEVGMGDLFVHSTGHGVGLRIHELPRVDRTSEAVLQPGNVLTVEPGVYTPGVGGVRVEDTVAVTDQGFIQITRHPKDPISC